MPYQQCQIIKKVVTGRGLCGYIASCWSQITIKLSVSSLSSCHQTLNDNNDNDDEIVTGRGLVVTLPVAGHEATEPETVFTTT